MARLQRVTWLASLTGVLAAAVLAGAPAPRASGLTALVAGQAPPAGASQDSKPRVNPNAKAVADFQEEVADYVELLHKLEGTLPKLPRDASPEAIDQHQRALGRLIQQARKNEGVGDIFEREVRPVIRRLLYGSSRAPTARICAWP